MKAPKAFIERAQKEGAMARVNQLISASYLLNCEASILQQEAEEILAMYGMHMGELKQKFNACMKASDSYFHEFASMITDPKASSDYFTDLDEFDKTFRKMQDLESGWKPNKEEA